MKLAVVALTAVGGLLLGGPTGHASCRCRAVADYGPAWSPSDDALAYTEAYEAVHVYSFAARTDTREPITSTSVAFSPDWSRIARVVAEGRTWALVVSRVDGSDPRRLATIVPTLPTWSPTGDRIAYVGADHDLYVIETGGGAPTRLAADADPYGARTAAWSPDGSRLAFGAGRALYVVPVAGGEVPRRIAETDTGAAMDPSWSPRGDLLAFTGSAGHAVQIVRADGTGSFRIDARVFAEDASLWLSWSPDGRRLLYGNRFSGASPYPEQGIYAIELSSGDQKRVVPFGLEPEYSHDGTRIAFAGRVVTEATSDAPLDCVGVGVWTVAADGGRPALATRTCTATPPTVSLRAPEAVTYGERVRIGGTLLPGFGPFARVFTAECAKPLQVRFTPIDETGAWTLSVAPRVLTSYVARSDLEEARANIAVRPRVTLGQSGARLRFEVKVVAARSFVGAPVLVHIAKRSKRIVLQHGTRHGRSVTTHGTFRLSRRDVRPWLEGMTAVLPARRCVASGVSNELSVSR